MAKKSNFLSRKEKIEYWVNRIWKDPEYYLNTESFCDEDIYEYAIELADSTEVERV